MVAHDKQKAVEVSMPRKLRHKKGKAHKILPFSCHQSLFGGSATGSRFNVVRIKRAEGENKWERKK